MPKPEGFELVTGERIPERSDPRGFDVLDPNDYCEDPGVAGGLRSLSQTQALTWKPETRFPGWYVRSRTREEDQRMTNKIVIEGSTHARYYARKWLEIYDGGSDTWLYAARSGSDVRVHRDHGLPPSCGTRCRVSVVCSTCSVWIGKQ